MQYKQNFYISKKLVSAFEKISNKEELTTKEVKALYKELDNAYKKSYVILFEYENTKKIFYDSESFRKDDEETYTLAIPDIFLNIGNSVSIRNDGTYSISSGEIIDSNLILPEVVNDRYLHTNEETGALEWSEVSSGGSLYQHILKITDNNLANGTNIRVSFVNNSSTRCISYENVYSQLYNLGYYSINECLVAGGFITVNNEFHEVVLLYSGGPSSVSVARIDTNETSNLKWYSMTTSNFRFSDTVKQII